MPDINFGADIGGAATGAASGLAFGPVGAAVGGLAGLATNLVPELFPHLFGRNSAAVQTAVKNAVSTVTGGKIDPAQVQAAINTDPTKKDELRQWLAEIAVQSEQAQRQADLDAVKAAIADTANARDQTAALVKAGNPMAWGAPIISMVVLLTFATVVLVALTQHPNDSSPLLNVVLGTLGTMATAVVSYWVGSSAGSAQKTALLAQAPAIK